MVAGKPPLSHHYMDTDDHIGTGEEDSANQEQGEIGVVQVPVQTRGQGVPLQ